MAAEPYTYSPYKMPHTKPSKEEAYSIINSFIGRYPSATVQRASISMMGDEEKLNEYVARFASLAIGSMVGPKEYTALTEGHRQPPSTRKQETRMMADAESAAISLHLLLENKESISFQNYREVFILLMSFIRTTPSPPRT